VIRRSAVAEGSIGRRTNDGERWATGERRKMMCRWLFLAGIQYYYAWPLLIFADVLLFLFDIYARQHDNVISNVVMCYADGSRYGDDDDTVA